MLIKKAGLALLVISACVFLAPGCAMSTRGPEQRIPITSDPIGAAVDVNGVRHGVTPLAIRLKRKQKGQVIRIESPGYHPVEIRLSRKASGGHFFGNVLFGALPGVVPAIKYGLSHDGEGFYTVWVLSSAAIGAIFTAFDGISGAANEFVPREIIVRLKKADGTARIDTLLLDADEFKNIMWIRVHRD